MSTVVARALTMLAVVFQTYFKWDSGDGQGLNTRSVTGPGSKSAYHLAGLILARGGSKGIPKKNLVEVNGRPLVGRALDAMIESGVFTTIWVSTDDPDINKWVTSNYPKGLVAVHKRAAYTATDSATSISAVLEFLSFHPEIDAMGLVQATSPFVQSQYLQGAVRKLFGKAKTPLYTSVFSVTRTYQLRWSVEHASSGHSNPTEMTKPLNFNPRHRPRRQDWQGEMVENGMFYFAFRDVLVNHQMFQSDRSSYIIIPKHLTLEIDSFEDLELAKCLAQRIDREYNSQSHQVKLNVLKEL